MSFFISTYTNKIDSKGRVSVPSSFRATLGKEDFSGIVAYPSFVHPCIEACGISRIEQLTEAIDNMDPYSEDRDAFATSILGGAEQLNFDKDGRVTLNEKLKSQANLKDQAVFVGKGKTFEIWEPKVFKEYSEKARELAKEKRGLLSLNGKIINKESIN